MWYPLKVSPSPTTTKPRCYSSHDPPPWVFFWGDNSLALLHAHGRCHEPPQTQRTRTATKWTCTTKEGVAFRLIKRALAGANVLRLADSTRPLILTADASLFGIGAELSQLDDDGHEHACGW